jgi:hypothetical protein
VAGLKPHVIVGVSAQPGSFSTEVLTLMGELNEQPLVFALSNPTSKVRVGRGPALPCVLVCSCVAARVQSPSCARLCMCGCRWGPCPLAHALYGWVVGLQPLRPSFFFFAWPRLCSRPPVPPSCIPSLLTPTHQSYTIHPPTNHLPHPPVTPTTQSECTAEAAYTHTGGRAIFASGSPFDPVTLHGKTHVPGQGNNSYIFPGVALAVTTFAFNRVPNALFATAARALADQVEESQLAVGCLYPPLSNIREVSARIAAAVAAEVRGGRGAGMEGWWGRGSLLIDGCGRVCVCRVACVWGVVGWAGM